MSIIIIILAVLLIGAAAFIFWLLKVLKNTLNITESFINQSFLNNTEMHLAKAYDGKYYPATVIVQVNFDQEYEGKVVDWSLYEDKKIVGFTLMTKDKIEDYYGTEFIEMLDEEDLEELQQPIIIKNAQVYAIKEGDWFWKSA